jgi:phenylacetate-CoA ligase
MSNNVSQNIFEMFMQSQFWPPEDMQKYQRTQLAQLLRHAKAEVPFYKDRLNPIFTQSGDMDWNRWAELPILKRSDVAENFEALQARQIPAGHGPVFLDSTSGSSGLPIKISSPKIAGDIGIVLDWRAHKWWGLDWTANLVRWFHNLPKTSQNQHMISRGAWGNFSDENAKKGQQFAISLNETVEHIVSHLQKTNARYLQAQGNFPFTVAVEMKKRGLFTKLDAVISHGVAVDAEFRAAFAESFGAVTRCMYSSREAARIAYSCPTGNHYHVCSEACFVEILDENGKTCKPGQEGRVIVTPFFNTGQPFIRYEQGDLASWGVCGCGIQLPVINSISGRLYHSFVKPDGASQVPYVADELRLILDAEFWQFVQTKPGAIDVLYKPMRKRSKKREQNFIPILLDALKAPYEISFSIITELPLTISGKFIKYLNAIKK